MYIYILYYKCIVINIIVISGSVGGGCMDFLLYFAFFCLGGAFVTVFNWFVGRAALSEVRRKYGNVGNATKREQESEMLNFMDELAEAWEKKPSDHSTMDFMMKDGGGLICLRHGPLILKHAGKLTKMVTKRLNVGDVEAGQILKGILSE
jgi:hypothetical protein